MAKAKAIFVASGDQIGSCPAPLTVAEALLGRPKRPPRGATAVLGRAPHHRRDARGRPVARLRKDCPVTRSRALVRQGGPSRL